MLKLKICILADTYLPYEGGTETFLKEMIGQMKKKVSIVSITRGHPFAEPYEKDENLEIHRVYNFPLPRIHKYFVMSFVTYLKARKIITNCDIIYVHNISPCFAAHFLKKRFKIPYIQTLETIPLFTLPTVAAIIHKIYLRALNFDRLVVWSEKLREKLEEWGLTSIVIPGGINTDKFSPRISGKKIKEKHGQSLIVTARPLYQSNAVGVSHLIKAMKNIDAKLLILGDGKGRNWLEKLTERLNLTNKITFLGAIEHDNVPKYYAAADVIVTPIIFDLGTRPSISLLEGMAMQKPNLLTKNFESGVINNKNICLAKIGDPLDMSDKINILLENKQKAKNIAKNCRKLVEKKYSMKIVCDKLIDLFESCLIGVPSN